MLPKTIILPFPKRIKDEDTKEWMEKLSIAMQKMWDRLSNEFIEGEHFISVGNDGKHIHGFVARKEDFVI